MSTSYRLVSYGPATEACTGVVVTSRLYDAAKVTGGSNYATVKGILIALQDLMPPGGARNAIDCALWDLGAKLTGRTIWDLTTISPKPLETVFTIGLEPTPEEMAAKAAAATGHQLLKIKLNDDRPLERVQAVRAARPDVRIVVDANQAWTFTRLRELAPEFAALGVQLIEQPLPRGEDAELEGYRAPVPPYAPMSRACIWVSAPKLPDAIN